jgi:hypothetical protein
MVSSAFRLRRFGVAVLIVVATVGFGVATAATAQACSVAAHCYGETFESPSGISGDFVIATPSCLSIPSGNFVTDEIWVTSSGNTYWVEAGYLQLGSNLSINGIPGAGRYGFWGDKRPGQQFVDHVLETNPSLSAGAVVEIWRNSSTSWNTNFDGFPGLSTGNTMTATTAIYGSETTTASAHSLFAGTGVEYKTGSTWHTGLPSPGVDRNAPQTFAWTSGHTNFKAGVPC